jgi:hypothetical protein
LKESHPGFRLTHYLLAVLGVLLPPVLNLPASFRQ